MADRRIDFVLNLCDCASTSEAATAETWFGRAVAGDHHGSIDVAYEITADDSIQFRVPELHTVITLGLASRMIGVVMRAREDRFTVQGIYDDPGLMLAEVCCHCGQTDCWGAVGCSCAVEDDD